MPAITTTSTPTTTPQRPIVAHVNMQLDSFLANSNIDDLRAIVRSLLATGPAGTVPAFTTIARQRVQRTTGRKLQSPSSYFSTDPSGQPIPTQALWDTVARARAHFGVGLGFESLPILLTIVNTTRSLRWEIESDMEDALIIIDGDIAQALQSCREQLTHPELVKDKDAARSALSNLKSALIDSRTEVEAWGGEFPFEKGLLCIDGQWKL
ncbi:hypothetical protein FRB99_003011 [Tulasnella sp. 403]|nr:hypothetical protein FRB99_003011 [Tulasnella sp. 403]